MGAFIDLTGRRFGRLTVLSNYGTAKDGGKVWLCRCDCGNAIVVKSGNLRSGHTLSCGCFMKDRISETQMVHGQSHKRLYNVWDSMKARCYNPNSRFFKDYGGRGITICEEWKNDYMKFHEWAMASGYNPEAPKYQCTIDRIDNDGPYAPWNCRWVDMKMQRHNRRR